METVGMSIVPVAESSLSLLIGCAASDGTHASHLLSRQVQQGVLLRLRRGVYFSAPAWFSAYPSQRHSWAAAATAAQLGDPVFCRHTALSLYDIPLLNVPQAVHVRAPTRSSARIAAQPRMFGRLPASDFVDRAQSFAQLEDLRPNDGRLQGFSTHFVSPETIGPLPPTHRVEVLGQALQLEPMGLVLADTVPRMPFSEAVTSLDAALRGTSCHPSLTKEQLGEVQDQAKHTKARRYAWEQALHFADMRAESAAESLSRVLISQLGFAVPALQTTVDVDGRKYRLDFEWEAAGVVGEFDGWAKYQQSGQAELRREKRREDDIRSTGRTVVRWYWEDLQSPPRLRAKLLRAGVPGAAA